VRMRRRKPCVLARRRLFGWKVRLLTAVSGARLLIRQVTGVHSDASYAASSEGMRQLVDPVRGPRYDLGGQGVNLAAGRPSSAGPPTFRAGLLAGPGPVRSASARDTRQHARRGSLTCGQLLVGRRDECVASRP
jgi:hypothetical protein